MESGGGDWGGHEWHLSNPRVSDDNSGKQLATRVAVTRRSGLQVGSSFARGAFVSRTALNALDWTDGSDFVQLAHGLDVEYSRGHWLTRAEAVLSEWRIPLMAEGARGVTSRDRVWSRGTLRVHPGRVRGRPGRAPRIQSHHGSSQRLAWDAPVTRVELGGGYYVQRNVIARVSFQMNRRDAGADQSLGTGGGLKVLFWF